MRGPYDTPKRDHVIKTRLDDDEYEFFLRKCQVYRMNQSEMIRAYNFNMLSQKYQAEQEELEEKIQTLKTDISTVKETADNAEKWIALIKKIGYPKELNAELLNTLIETILIHEAAKDEFGTRNQDIEIIYRFVGKID